METYDIYSLLKHDIKNSENPNLYYINQENDINVFNTHKKKAWRRSLDAYQVNKYGKTYHCSYLFDNKKNYEAYRVNLSFNSFSDKAGLDLADFIESVINADELIFVQVNGFEVCDFRKKLFLLKKIQIKNTKVDNMLITLINRYFRDLEQIEFINCFIKKDCDFSKMSVDIEFNKSIIENFRVFNDTKAKIKFFRTKINKIIPTTVNSNSIDFSPTNELLYKELFLKCNFLKLENLDISPESCKFGFSYNNEFLYLSSSAPMLENFHLEGKLSSFDFILDIKNLLRCSIDSFQNIHGTYFPGYDNKEEFLKAKKRNQKEYEISKLLNPNSNDNYIVGKLELDRIVKLARFKRLISFSKEELEFLEKNPNLINYLINKEIKNGEVTNFYELFYDKLILRNTNNEQDIRLGLEETYFNLNGFLYEDKISRFMDTSRKQIVPGKTFIYNYDLKPIIFKNRKKQISSLIEAEKFLKKHPYKEGLNEKSFFSSNYNDFIEFLKNLKEHNEDISVGCLLDSIREVANYSPTIDDFKKLGQGGRYIASLLEKKSRSKNRSNSIYDKNLKFVNLTKSLIKENYNLFTLEEKIVLVHENIKYEIEPCFRVKEVLYEDHIKELEERCKYEEILKSINLKTNGLYNKYLNIIKMTFYQYQIFERTYDYPVEKEFIKNLKL